MLAILSWCEFLRVPFGPVAKMSAQSSLVWRVLRFRLVRRLSSRGQTRCVVAAGSQREQATHAGPAIARTVLDSARYGVQTTLASAHTTLKGVLRIRRDQQETPHALEEAELRSWLRFGEAYSAFAGLASHIRPLLASIPSCSVPEAKILPTTRDTNYRVPLLLLLG